MPTRDKPWPAGSPCWVDYAVADIDAAKSFYGDVLGWTFTAGQAEFGGYLTCQAGGRAAAGMMPQMSESTPAGWTTYFASDDADATAAAITAAGGTIVAPPMDVGPIGRMAIALDPQGNSFGVWQAAAFIGVEIYNEPGGLVWNDAGVADPPAARSFYGTVFGWRFDAMDMAGGPPDYTTFATDAGPLGGLYAGQPGSTGWGTCFSVASTDDTVATAEKAGGSVSMPSTDMSFGRFAGLLDPWGAAFAVMQEPASG
jgi:predicted enzyme related to lactoylglutathione lyase